MTNIVNDGAIIKDLEASGQIGPRVLTVEATAHSDIEDIGRAARSVSYQVRRLDCQGYDLKHIEVKATLLRDDHLATVGPDASAGPHVRAGQK